MMQKYLLFFHTSNYCNYNCWYCSAKKHNTKDPEKAYYEKKNDILNWFEKYIDPEKYFTLFTGGGEPATHPDFCEIISCLSKKGHRGQIRTNGSLPIPKSNFTRIATWHQDYDFPKYYDKILILENPNEDWKSKVEFCEKNNIYYRIGELKNHDLPKDKRFIPFAEKSPKIFCRSWCVFAGGSMRACNNNNQEKYRIKSGY